MKKGAAFVRDVPPSIGFPPEWEVVVGDRVLARFEAPANALDFANGYNLGRAAVSGEAGSDA